MMPLWGSSHGFASNPSCAAVGLAARGFGVRMAMLAWMMWGVVLLLGCYAVFTGNQQAPEHAKENWSPQALDGFYNDRKGFRDAGFIVILCCLLVLVFRVARS
jgi:hypothetical protein